jgi:hypothetical protein
MIREGGDRAIVSLECTELCSFDEIPEKNFSIFRSLETPEAREKGETELRVKTRLLDSPRAHVNHHLISWTRPYMLCECD